MADSAPSRVTITIASAGVKPSVTQFSNFNCLYQPKPRYNRVMAWQHRISVNPAVRSGKPCIKGTRITVYDVLEYLAGGMTEDEILSDFPDLTREDIRAALAFAAARERRLANSVA